MRVFLDRAIEMRHRNQIAEIEIPRLVLRIEREPVDRRGTPSGMSGRLTASNVPTIGWTPALMHASSEKASPHRGRCDRLSATAGKPSSGALGDRLGLDRAFEHRVGREDPKRNESRMRHAQP
jgi:hypothetical protein